MKKLIIVLFALILFNSVLFSQENAIDQANIILEQRGEVYFKFQNTFKSDRSLLNKMSSIISIDRVDDENVFAYANKIEFTRFLDYEISFDVLQAPSMQRIPRMLDARNATGTDDWDYYPTYDAYLDMMNQFVIDYPELCELVNIGQSVDGRELLCIHINNNLVEDQDEPEFLYTSSMHGDEITGYVLMLRLIDYLLENYGNDDMVTNLVDNLDIWINPLANPDGTYAGGNNTVSGATRSNANFVDLNRNYPDPEDGDHPDGNAWQTETIHFMDFAEAHDFVMSANFHGGAEVLNYPWDTWYKRHADTDWWIYVCRQYADTVHAHSPSGYLNDLDNGITNGYDWYSISGGRQDYMNYFHHCREVTIEISSSKTPPAGQLPDFWEYNYRSFLNYMEQTLFGLRGIITDASNSNPIEAKVFINDHDEDESWVFSSLPEGNYHRPIAEGSYSITFSHFGYFPETVDNVAIINDDIEILDIELQPITELTAGFNADKTIFGTGGVVNFTDQSYGVGIEQWKWIFEGAVPETSSEQNPIGVLYNVEGDFDVSLTVYDNSGDSSTLLIEDYIQVKQTVEMSNQTITSCNVLFYDSGGEGNNYSDGEVYTLTITPDTEQSWIRVEFIDFNVEDEASCNYDYLKIYNGSDANAPLIGTWCGTDSPGTIIADNEEGSLTFYFFSDQNVTKSGWKALVRCDTSIGVAEHKTNSIRMYPNPTSQTLNIEADFKISLIRISDINGRELISLNAHSNFESINLDGLENGVYIVQVIGKGISSVSKFIKK